jgi:hypothetical protein
MVSDAFAPTDRVRPHRYTFTGRHHLRARQSLNHRNEAFAAPHTNRLKILALLSLVQVLGRLLPAAPCRRQQACSASSTPGLGRDIILAVTPT